MPPLIPFTQFSCPLYPFPEATAVTSVGVLFQRYSMHLEVRVCVYVSLSFYTLCKCEQTTYIFMELLSEFSYNNVF